MLADLEKYFTNVQSGTFYQSGLLTLEALLRVPPNCPIVLILICGFSGVTQQRLGVGRGGGGGGGELRPTGIPYKRDSDRLRGEMV